MTDPTTSSASVARARARAGARGRGRLRQRRATDPLAETVGRLLRPRLREAPEDRAAVLAQRLDDRGCATGRVTAARVDELSRAFDRLEAKLNAILVAVTATFLSTLLGLVVVALRTRGLVA